MADGQDGARHDFHVIHGERCDPHGLSSAMGVVITMFGFMDREIAWLWGVVWCRILGPP